MIYIVPIKNEMNVAYNSSVYTVNYFNEIISTTALDKANTDWDDTSSFAKDSWVRIAGLKRVYRCAAEVSTNQYPPANPSVWIDYGATNSYKMFDDIIGSQTEFIEELTVTVGANLLNSIAILNLDNVSAISLVQTDLNTNEILLEKTINLTDYGVLSLYDYWYKPLLFERDFINLELIFSPNAEVKITFSSASTGKVGAVVTGLTDNIGLTLFGTKIKLKDYSKYDVDDYGNTSFSKRGYSRIITGKVIIDTSLVDETLSKLARLRGSLTLFIGDDSNNGFKSLTTLGYISEIEIEPKASKTDYPIKIIGVI